MFQRRLAINHKVRNIVLGSVGVIIFLLGGTILFLKYDTTAAANLTDNILRPLLGDRLVLGLEKVYFNASDQAQQLASRNKTPVAPLFIDQGVQSLAIGSGGNLDLRPIPVQNFTPLSREGVWHNQPLVLFPDQQVAASTFIRPDPTRSFAFATILQLDMSKIGLGAVAGTKQPGGPVGKPGPGVIPQDILSSGRLIGAFDGGFQYRDGKYGMIVGSTTYLPLQPNIGTVAGTADGTFRIFDYTGQALDPKTVFVRQNCPILVQNGSVTASDEKNKSLWGRTFSADIVTWRSGIGQMKNGNLLFAVGNNLTPATLGEALRSAGAVNAIQLDINPVWVRFNLFTPTGPGTYSSSTLTRDLKDGSQQYLHGYTKDFFYLFKK